MPELVTLSADTSADEIIAVLERDGALILEGLISEAEVDAIAAELKPYVDVTRTGNESFSGHRTTRTGALVARSPRVRTLVLDRRIRALCDHVLLPHCERYQLHLGQVIRIMPGQEAQVIHRDRWAWGPWLKGIEPQLNTIWALTDFTRENGATQVVPGSPSWPDDRQPEPHEIGYAEMKRGSALIYTGSVLHGGGANVTDHDRIGLNLTYSLAWLRQEENQYLACPPEIARDLDPELQELVGYAMGSFSLGYYTPPLPAGVGPEAVSPSYALTGIFDPTATGTDETLVAMQERIRSQAAG
jgi:ectoine hydroxylase-related dioxygenase (phytanoyl-CoA dioxygenase family)